MDTMIPMGAIPICINRKYRSMTKINFSTILDQVVPLASCGSKLRINNIVGTVKLLGDGESICLESIAARFGGLVKYAPKKFAAAILRVKDPISTTTCLAFRSGKIVVVGAHSEDHSLCACQKYRRMIESVLSIYSHQGK
jgi:TATA-box binding protein (TBP) (component of TFIID and TFIIIB)